MFDDVEVIKASQITFSGELVVPEKPNKMGVVLDRLTIEDVINNHFSLKLRVKIKWVAGGIPRGGYYTQQVTYGKHILRTDTIGHYHQINLSTNRANHQVNHTLWHELTHCFQAETVCENPKAFYREHYKPYGISGEVYKNNPYEVEANQVADENQHIKLHH